MWRLLGLVGLVACDYSPPGAAPSDGSPPQDVADGPVDGDGDGPPPAGRITDRLIGQWLFDLSDGVTVDDSSSIAPAVSPVVTTASSVTWGTGTMRIDVPVDINSGFTGGNRLLIAGEAASAVTIEVWATPANETQNGLAGQPSRIMSFGPANGGNHEISIGQAAGQWVGQARTATAGVDKHGGPFLMSPVVATTTHLVVTVDGTDRKLYVNGELAASDTNGGSFAPWDMNHALSFAGDSAINQWLGTLHLAAMYDRVLTGADVMQNFLAGP